MGPLSQLLSLFPLHLLLDLLGSGVLFLLAPEQALLVGVGRAEPELFDVLHLQLVAVVEDGSVLPEDVPEDAILGSHDGNIVADRAVDLLHDLVLAELFYSGLDVVHEY